MELLKTVGQRSKLSEILYIAFNITFALVLLGLTIAFQPPILAYLLVLLSKWRIFAVRPRFWFANIQANTVDLLVGVSIVTMIWQATGSIAIQVFTAALFALWLLFIKPKSKRKYIVLQAGIAQFLGITALFSLAYLTYSFVAVLIAWVIGYVVARHILTHYEDPDITAMSMVWGVVVAQFAWLAYHSTTAYGAPGFIMIPQVALLVSIVGFAAYSVYNNYREHDGVFRLEGVKSRLLFSSLAVVILLARELVTLI